MQACRVLFYSDSQLDKEAILPHVLHSERRMPVPRLMGLKETEDGLQVQVRWRALSNSEDTLEPLQRACNGESPPGAKVHPKIISH